MGQIANQMFVEWCYKIAQKIGRKRDIQRKKGIPEKENRKENASQDESRLSGKNSEKTGR